MVRDSTYFSVSDMDKTGSDDHMIRFIIRVEHAFTRIAREGDTGCFFVVPWRDTRRWPPCGRRLQQRDRESSHWRWTGSPRNSARRTWRPSSDTVSLSSSSLSLSLSPEASLSPFPAPLLSCVFICPSHVCSCVLFFPSWCVLSFLCLCACSVHPRRVPFLCPPSSSSLVSALCVPS